MPFANFYPLTPIEEVFNIDVAFRVGIKFGGNQLDVWQSDNLHNPSESSNVGESYGLLACGLPELS